jgi:hypothetical protein
MKGGGGVVAPRHHRAAPGYPGVARRVFFEICDAW